MFSKTAKVKRETKRNKNNKIFLKAKLIKNVFVQKLINFKMFKILFILLELCKAKEVKLYRKSLFIMKKRY